MSAKRHGGTDIRWMQRFQNLDRAVKLLREAVDLGVENLSDLEKEGMIQRFEVALELCWKTLQDFLEYEGQTISPITPRNVIKGAFAAKVIPDGQVWIDMLDHRNLLSHTYDATTFEEAAVEIANHYFPAMENLRRWLGERVNTS